VPAFRAAGCAGLIAALTLALTACGSTAPTPGAAGSEVAEVAGTVITQEQLDVRLQSALADIAAAGGPTSNAAMLTSVTATVIGSLIFDTVVAQEAQRLHVAASPNQVQDRIRQFTQDAGGATQLQAQLAAAGQSIAGLRDEITAEIDEQDVESYFAQARVQEVLQQLRQGAAFATLAGQYDDAPDSAAKAGELGALTAAQVTSELGAAVLSAIRSLEPGQYTASPVRTSAGYEILEVEAVTPTTWTLREILVAAPQPYTVKERPDWFAEEVYYQIYEDCQAGRISLFGSYAKVKGADPCTSGPAAVAPAGSSPGPTSAAPSPSPGSPASSPRPSPSG
jgi:hypothetical protein